MYPDKILNYWYFEGRTKQYTIHNLYGSMECLHKLNIQSFCSGLVIRLEQRIDLNTSILGAAVAVLMPKAKFLLRIQVNFNYCWTVPSSVHFKYYACHANNWNAEKLYQKPKQSRMHTKRIQLVLLVSSILSRQQ